MPTPSRDMDAPVKVVLIDSTTPEALERCLRQALRAREVGESVVITSRVLRLPAALARRVTVMRTDTHLLELLASAEAAVPRLVVVAPTSCSFTDGWAAAVVDRVSRYGQVISMVGHTGRSVLVVPPAVTDLTVTRVAWLDARGIRLRESAATRAVHQTLSAVMIVKDEEDVLDECLTALAPFVDEVVVYDTGSTDSTTDIARRHGAVVVKGYWNDSFGDARNRALAHATGDWVMQVDADEVMEGDAGSLRAQLDTEQCDQLSITILSTTFRGGTSGVESQRPSFFRRGRYQWVGALHEYPVPLPGVSVTGLSPQHPAVRLVHSGYQPERTEARDKTNRNLALSSKELEATPASDPARATMLSNQARTLMWANKVEEALSVFEELRTTPGNPTSIVIGGRSAVEALLGLGRVDEVDAWLEVLATNGESAGNIAVYRARRHLTVGAPDAALAAIQEVSHGRGGTDVWGVAFDAARVDVVEAAAQMSRGDAEAATALLVDLVMTSPDAVPFSLLLTAMTSTGRSLDDIAAIAPESFLQRSLREAAASHPVAALAWLEACFTAHPDDARVVVAGNIFAARAGWRVALVWAARAAEVGLSADNALHTLAETDTAPLVERAIASALLAESFGDLAAEASFEALTSQLPPEHLEVLVVDLAELGIDVTAASTSDEVGAL